MNKVSSGFLAGMLAMAATIPALAQTRFLDNADANEDHDGKLDSAEVEAFKQMRARSTTQP
jgi:hypothetical protein